MVFGFLKIRTVQKFDYRSDGVPTETACNPQFKLQVTKITFLAFSVQINVTHDAIASLLTTVTKSGIKPNRTKLTEPNMSFFQKRTETVHPYLRGPRIQVGYVNSAIFCQIGCVAAAAAA